jgi:NAD(P)-dependent dehydrogenase (short-subunit alcohol dehydrogenase family)
MSTGKAVSANRATARDALVVIGVGGMGQAVVRRVGSGRSVLIADVDRDALEAVTRVLVQEGHDVVAHRVDVSDPDAVGGLADAAAQRGPVRYVVHTAGLSPVQASAQAIVQVDLVGVALILEEFARVITSGGAAVVIASMAGHMAGPITPEDEVALARTPARDLTALACVEACVSSDSGLAYAFAKRANVIRVRAASVDWGRRGARVNSISPGVISTPMGEAELAGPVGGVMRAMIEASGTQRVGTPDDIAASVEFLLSPQASFITGTDLLVDGGVVGALSANPPATAPTEPEQSDRP